MARDWFDKMTNNESVWEEQPAADMATIMHEAITETKQGTPAESRYGREPDKVKPLAQYLDEYIEHEVELDNLDTGVSELFAYDSWRELFEQAFDAYESTENVKIRIERV